MMTAVLFCKAYNEFINGIISAGDEVPKRTEKSLQPIISLFENERKNFVEQAAEIFRLANAVYEPESEEFYGSGLSDLIMNAEAESKDDVLEIVEDFERLSDRIEESRNWWESESRWPKVFVGGSPFTKSKRISVIAEKFADGGESFFFLMLGPTRMDYRKLLDFFKILENHCIDRK